MKLPVLNNGRAARSPDHDHEVGPGAPGGNEFPDGAFELDGPSRRSFIQLMGASLALAGLSGCRRPEEKILPYGRAPEEVVPGRPQRFASAFPFRGDALGVVVESHEGRPTKLEGNPLHPSSRGGADAFAQASILELYDPDRSRGPRFRGIATSWDEALGALRAALTPLADGRGLAVITEAHRSPTLAAQLATLRQRFPAARIVRWEPLDDGAARQGARMAFGRPLDAVYDSGHARVLATFDDDLLASVAQARGFADGRRGAAGAGNRLYAVESRFSLTGTAADHRLRVRSRRVHGVLLALAHAVGVEELPAAPSLDPREARFVAALGRDLLLHRGAALVSVGAGQPAAVHALGHLVNAAVAGATVRWQPPFSDAPEGAGALVDLAAAMRRGEIKVALICGGNPLYDAPADADFAAALAHVPTSAHLSSFVDETSAACTFHLARAHWLEGWSDVRAQDGTLSVVQPLIAPLHGGKTDAEVLERILGGTRSAYQLVQASFPASGGAGLRRALHDGVHPEPAPTLAPPAPRPDAAALAALPDDGALEVTFAADVHAFDGRFANNGWLQELPDPMTKLTWDNAALLSPASARRLGLASGDMVDLVVGGRGVRLPVLIAPGQADDSLALTLGQGRRRAGSVGTGVGFDVYPLRTSSGLGFATATLQRTGRTHRLAIAHGHHSQEGRPLVRQATVAEAHEDPAFAKKPDEEHPPLVSLWKEHEYQGHKWGMVIDLQSCIGCNACTVACQAENNIPLVGKTGVEKSREMHWIRIDRYFTDGDDPESVAQPIACQQCEQAPCEQVCPVGATTHSPEGLNDMAYNRCIGTRYCANNCPYKVRRFNFFNYQKDLDELRKMQFNPDVTVRSRGVMEKCTYCVQRINGAKSAAHQAGRDRVRDGEVVTACQQTCPTRAITFGDLNDPSSEVARRAADPRNYVLLEELNIKPRTSFLARVRNPNPELG
jgi:molybdopterin-containing oxidoreductase family iron-sulfur binding subunit